MHTIFLKVLEIEVNLFTFQINLATCFLLVRHFLTITFTDLETNKERKRKYKDYFRFDFQYCPLAKIEFILEESILLMHCTRSDEVKIRLILRESTQASIYMLIFPSM